MNYYRYVAMLRGRVNTLIEINRNAPVAFDGWFNAVADDCGCSRKMVLKILEEKGYAVKNNKVVENELI